MNTREFVVMRIGELCNEQNLSLCDISLRAGLAASTVKNITSGTSRNPGVITLKKICDGLNISLKDFFDTPMYDQVEDD